MDLLKKFSPKNYKSLSIEERIIAIKQLANHFFKKLNLKPIGITFDTISDEKTVGGIFMKGVPTFICLNSFFLDYSFAENKFRKDLDLDVFLPYFLVASIAHECYHYYQYELVNNLVAEKELTPKQKDKAYLYFISLYEKLFAAICEEKGILPEDDLTPKEIYALSPSEISANEFASGIVTDLATFDELHNYLYYSYYIGLMDSDVRTDVEEDVIMHDLNVALTLLKHKNQTAVSRGNYLGIDPNELEESILRQVKKRKELKVKKEKLSGTGKLLEKISKK